MYCFIHSFSFFIEKRLRRLKKGMNTHLVLSLNTVPDNVLVKILNYLF